MLGHESSAGAKPPAIKMTYPQLDKIPCSSTADRTLLKQILTIYLLSTPSNTTNPNGDVGDCERGVSCRGPPLPPQRVHVSVHGQPEPACLRSMVGAA